MSDDDTPKNGGTAQHVIPMGQMGLKKRIEDLEARVQKLEQENQTHAAVNVMMAEKYAALRDLVMRAVEAVNRAAARIDSKNGD